MTSKPVPTPVVADSRPVVETPTSSMRETFAAEGPAGPPAIAFYQPREQHSEPHYDSPLYTEIQIPLPPLPGSPASPTSPTRPLSPKSESSYRAPTLHSFSPFRRRRPSSPTASRPVPDRISRQDQFVEFSMRAVGKGRRKRAGSHTIDAAIMPAVMVLSAELFTPGGPDRGRGKAMMDKLEVVK